VKRFEQFDEKANQDPMEEFLMNDKTRIVIIGGGFAGTATALNLEKSYRHDPSVEITLIDAENFFTFTPLLAEVPSGSIQPKHIVFPLRALLKQTKVKQAEVQIVDLKRRTVIAAHCGACANGPDSLTQPHPAGASNAKAKCELNVQPRPMEWIVDTAVSCQLTL
jgi:nucleoside-diphosphate-sugar epimerase